MKSERIRRFATTQNAAAYISVNGYAFSSCLYACLRVLSQITRYFLGSCVPAVVDAVVKAFKPRAHENEKQAPATNKK